MLKINEKKIREKSANKAEYFGYIWYVTRISVYGGPRAAVPTKMFNGQVPQLPGSRRHAGAGARIVPWRQPGDCNKSAIAPTAPPPEPDE